MFADKINRMKNTLKKQLEDYPGLELLVLIGSQAKGTANVHSDWDFALRWLEDSTDFMGNLARTEELRAQLAQWLKVSPERIDLVLLPDAGLTMRAAVAEEGVPLKGDDSLAWFHFLTRTWRELEDWYWENEHAA